MADEANIDMTGVCSLGSAAQNMDFKSGNEMATLAARQINYHVMGFFPITPSTEIAEGLDELFAQGLCDTRLVASEGEHSAAGICYGASTAGGRVLNATSAQGLLYAMEQLPVQSGTRFPMVMNIVTRAVNGPLNIRGDHSDLMMMLNSGWIILMARNQQAVYDMNIMAPRIGEHEAVRLPVAVAFDGFFTSHQKRRVEYFVSDSDVREFLGPYREMQSSVRPDKPMTIGPYMNDPDLINNKYQLHLAMEAAREVIPEVFAEFVSLSGRQYPLVDSYLTDDAEAGLFALNSAAEIAKDAADSLRREGEKVGVISPNVIRPFPVAEMQAAAGGLESLVIAERADSYGGNGGSMTFEIKAALHDLPGNSTRCVTRIYGLGGRDFYTDDAESLLRLAVDAAGGEDSGARVAASGGEAAAARIKSFDYYGVTPGDKGWSLEPVVRPIPPETTRQDLVKVEQDPETGRLKVRTGSARAMTALPKRIAPGHGACPGCGIFPNLNQFFKGIEGHVVALFQTGCAMVVTTPYPDSSHRVTYIHNLFQNGAATLSGVVEMYRERQRRGEIPADEQLTFVMVSGDGGMDIGMGSALGAALRDHGMIIVEYDNEGYMNTGNQLSYSVPLGTKTTTSGIGPVEKGKSFHHKDTAQIMAATNIKYVGTSVEGLSTDLVKKAAKAQWYANRGHLAYVKLLSACPLSWRSDEKMGTEIMRAAVDCNFFPVYEVEQGITTINYDPEKRKRRVPLADWLNMMPRSRHLTGPDYREQYEALEAEIDRRWQRLKAEAENELL
ncbi:MAG: pyruvate synthase [Thermoleophilia bacterium]|nr:pyruvate synthase [Thermoleophilia bacterium]